MNHDIPHFPRHKHFILLTRWQKKRRRKHEYRIDQVHSMALLLYLQTLNAFPLPSNQSPPPKTSSATTFSTPMTCQWQQLARLTRSTALHITPKTICHLTPYSLFCCDWLPPRLTPNKKNISNHNHHVTWTWEVESRMQTSFTGKVSGDVPEQKLRQISRLMSSPFCGEASNMITDDTHMPYALSCHVPPQNVARTFASGKDSSQPR